MTAQSNSQKNSITGALNPIFDIGHTNAAKGMALLLLLWHHLFLRHKEFGVFIHESAIIAKVCVTLFILLSGYGLAQSVARKPMGIISFYIRRFSLIYLNYWLVAAIFISIGVFIMGRTLEDVYKTSIPIKFMIQISGLHYFFDQIGPGYNSTWWFISLTLFLYFIFPFLYTLLSKWGGWCLLFLLILQFVMAAMYQPQSSSFLIRILQIRLFPFALGIYFSLTDAFAKTSIWLKKSGFLRFGILMFMILISILARNYSTFLRGERADVLLGTAIILLNFEFLQVFPKIKPLPAYLGEHLFNVFLFHSFLTLYYWPEIVYVSSNPIIVFVVLLLECLIISIFINLIKRFLSFNEIISWIEKLKLHENIVIGRGQNNYFRAGLD